MNIGKKILSAFVEVSDQPQPKPAAAPMKESVAATPVDMIPDRFQKYFEQLFEDANLPGPDYHEFTKMTAAMRMIADEQARYQAAFAGLSVQGLTKQKLMSTATEYLNLVESDSVNFQASISQAMEEKVKGRQREIEEKAARIQLLTNEITELHQQMTLLQKEMMEQESKIAVSSKGYQSVAEACKAHIKQDMEKIGAYIS